MKQKLLLLTMLSMGCWGASAEIVVQKSFENNLKWNNAYVITANESITYTYLWDEKVLGESDLIGLGDGKTNPYTVTLADCELITKEIRNKTYEFYTFNNGISVDTFKAAIYSEEGEYWVAEDGEIYTQSECFQLTTNEGKIIDDNNSYNGAINVQGNNNRLQCFDGDTLRNYILLIDFGIHRNANDTITQEDNVTYRTQWAGHIGNSGYAYANVNCENGNNYFDPLASNDGSWNDQDLFKDSELAFKLPVGKNLVHITAYTYTGTRDFVQKGHYELYDTVYVVCNLPEFEDVKLKANQEKFCFGEYLVIEVDNWNKYNIPNYGMKYKLSNKYTEVKDAFEHDSLSSWDAVPGMEKWWVERTDACGRKSMDTISLKIAPRQEEWEQIGLSMENDTVCLGEPIVVKIDKWKEFKKLYDEYYDKKEENLGYIAYLSNTEGNEYPVSMVSDSILIDATNLSEGIFTLRVKNIGFSCFDMFGEIEFTVKDCTENCPNDTIHIKPLTFDIVKNGVCDFSLVYTLKSAEGCPIYYAIDLDMEDCDGNEEASSIDLTVNNNYIDFNEETKVTIFSVDGRKVYDGKCSSVKLESGIYIVTTANAYRKVIIK